MPTGENARTDLLPDARIGETVRQLIEQRLGAFWTAVLGRVEEIDQEEARAIVKPLLKLPTGPDRWEGLKEIYKVPVDIARAGPFYVRRPYQKGDIVLLVVSSRSLERTLYDHEQRETGFSHVNQLDDVILVGGFRADTDEKLPDQWINDLVIQNVTTKDTIVLRGGDKDGNGGGAEVYLASHKRGYSLTADLLEDLRARSFRGRIELDAAREILLGLPKRDTLRVCLYPLVEWCAQHRHLGVTPGEGTTLGPDAPPPDSSASKFVFARYAPPGERPFPEIKALGERPGITLQQIEGFTGWVSSISQGSGIGLGDLLAAIGSVLGAIGEAIGEAIGGFLETMGRYALWLAEVGIPALVEAVTNAIAENWVALLVMAVSNPVGAVALLVEAIARNLFSEIADPAIEQFFNALGAFMCDIGICAVGDYLASIDGLDDLSGFAVGLGELIANGIEQALDFERISADLLRWATEKYGGAGTHAAIASILGALLSWLKDQIAAGTVPVEAGGEAA